MMLMRELRWRRGITDKDLARHWGLTVDSIRQYSADAWRRLKAEVTDPDSTAATICTALEKVVQESQDKGLHGHRSVIEASKAWAAISGAGAPTRFEIGALANLSDVELEKKRRDLMRRLRDAQPELAVVRELPSSSPRVSSVELSEDEIGELDAREEPMASGDAESLDSLPEPDGSVPVG